MDSDVLSAFGPIVRWGSTLHHRYPYTMATRTSTAELRDAMFDAARDLIARIGYSEMSHADITYAVGIGRTTFYEHFSSKEDLLIQLVRRISSDHGRDPRIGRP